MKVLIPEILVFFETIKEDSRICPVHISMFMAIIQCWHDSGFKSPVCIERRRLMKLAKISGAATYHRVIKDLDEFGYIQYKPSHNCLEGTFVYILSAKKCNV